MASVDRDKLIPYMDAYLAFLSDKSRGDVERALSNNQEDYKRRVAIKASEALDCENWNEDEIGKGFIGDNAIKAVQRNQNLIGRFQVTVFSDKVRENLAVSERLLFDFYHDHKEQECFDRICKLIGRKYDLVAYLYFILDPERYLPLRSSIFDNIFRKLGINLQITDRCSWENYQEFIETIANVRDVMKDYYKIDDIDLLDAHSFLWTIKSENLEVEKEGADTTNNASTDTSAKVGTVVFHKDYGEGQITKITDEKIYVDFNGKKRIFRYPEAFEKEYLTL